MPTVSAGGSASITVYDNGTLSVASNAGFASVAIAQTAGPAISESWGPGPFRKIYGPFKEGATATVSSQTADVDYDTAPISAAVQAAVSGAGNYRGASTEAAPVSGFQSPATGTVLSGLTPFYFAPNYFANDGDYLDVRLECLRTGSAGNATIELRWGPLNNVSQPILISRAFGTASARPTFVGRITRVSANTLQYRGQSFFQTAGINVDQPAGTVGTPTANQGTITTDLTVGNYLVVSCNSGTAPDTVALQNYELRRSFP